MFIPSEVTTTKEDETDVATGFSEGVRENGTERGERGYISCGSKVAVYEELGRVGTAEPVTEQLRCDHLLSPTLILMEHFFCARCHVL